MMASFAFGTTESLAVVGNHMVAGCRVQMVNMSVGNAQLNVSNASKRYTRSAVIQSRSNTTRLGCGFDLVAGCFMHVSTAALSSSWEWGANTCPGARPSTAALISSLDWGVNTVAGPRDWRRIGFVLL